jgi:ribosomal protein S4E
VTVHSLTEGKVESAELLPESTDRAVTKIMKVLTITRTPGGRIARIDLVVSGGRNIELEVDEPTARAIAKVFDAG